MPDMTSLTDSVQHLIVTLVALGALAIVLRKVLGVFGGGAIVSSTTASGSGKPSSAAPACGHCAAGTAATTGPRTSK